MKKNLWLLPTLLLFVPLVAGAILWQQLPEQIPFFLPNDGFELCGRGFFVFGLPFCALVTHFCFVGLCALTPWLRHPWTDLPRPGFWWAIPTLYLLDCAWSYSRVFGGALPFILAAVVLATAIILWLILIRRYS